jgi:carbon monoxide dehydrogenase subunit G
MRPECILLSVKIETGFALSLPVHDAWPLLTDLGRVAPSMPGVAVDSFDDEGLRATMRVKVGPVTTAYRMLVRLESLDQATHTAVLKASGRETHGPGTVEATVVASLTGEDGHTAVKLTTDLAVTGRVAQFGGGVMTEVADRLLVQFTERLEQDLAGGEPLVEGARSRPIGADGQPPQSSPPPVDLGRTAGRVILRRAGRFALVAGPALVLVLALRRRRN